MQRASQQAPTQTTATPETSRAAAPESAQSERSPAYSGNRAALRRLAAAYPNLQRNLLGESAAAEPPRTPIAVSPAPPQISRACAHCEDEEKQTTVQRKESAAAQPTAPASVYQALNSPGQPLDPATLAFMEPRFGSDFSQVRIHTGRQPSDSARSIGASAYTVGRDIVFATGHYAPNTPKGQRLLAHELTHVLQQGSSAVARSVQRDLVYGSDYKSPYSDDATESRSSEAGNWYPSTVDFTATASSSGGGTGAPTFDDLIKTIAAKGKGSITSLGIIGHATTDLISLSGTITVSPSNVTFTGGGVIDSTAITAKMADITAVRDRFAAGANIILYGCHAGIGNSLMAALSSAFQVCVQGFSDEVWWCISWNLPSRKITSRGRTYVDTSGMMAAGLVPKDCQSTFNADIGQLKPDRKDCSGVPAAAPAQPNPANPNSAGSAAPNATSQQAPPAVQTKLVVNTPGDAFEQEADRVADRVMRMADPAAVSSASEPIIQRDEAPVDTGVIAAEIEQLVRPGNDEKGALDKLKALDMAVLLKVVEQLYDDAFGVVGDEGKRNSYTILGNDILPPDARPTPGPGDSLTDAERTRLRAAFDAAPTRKLRNPKEDDPGTSTTLSGARDKSKSTTMARPGDWGEDPGGNTWVCHADGIRSYFATGVPSENRTSTWLGNNPSNFDYAPSLTKRAISSFHWGKSAHDFAIYLTDGDASEDLRKRVEPAGTIGNYIKTHLGNNPKDKNRSPEEYIKFMNRAVKVNAGDSCESWTADAGKWAELIKGFKAAEGWNEPKRGAITAANVKTLSSDAKDAALITYYQTLLGVTP
jgi:Domain of unknown function (DUF4157)